MIHVKSEQLRIRIMRLINLLIEIIGSGDKYDLFDEREQLYVYYLYITHGYIYVWLAIG